MPWPPTLSDLKAELKTPAPDDRDDATLAAELAAAIAYVEGPKGRAGELNFTADPDSLLPEPSADVELGTLRLAVRWHDRRRSPDGLVDGGEFGTARVPTLDVDLERLLGIGRFRLPMVG